MFLSTVRYKLIYVIICITFSSSTVFAEEADDRKWLPWVGLAGVGATDDESRAEAQLFLPVWQNDRSLVFIDVRGKFFEKDVKEGNLGLGFRTMLENGWNLGAWVGADTRVSQSNNQFYQLSGGLEALHPDWDVRLNGYQSLSNNGSSSQPGQLIVSGSQLLVSGLAEVPLSGFDIEFGARVPIERFIENESHRHELRLYVGGFHFDDSDADEAITGPKARATWQINDVFERLPGTYISFESEFSYDDVRDDYWEAGIRVVIPIGTKKKKRSALTLQERRMDIALVRDTDIVVGKSAAEKVIDAVTGVVLNTVEVVGEGESLQTAIDTGQNTLIIANGNVAGTGILQENQTLASGGATLRLTGKKSGGTSTVTVPGARGSITHTTGSPAVTVASNTHVLGMVIEGVGSSFVPDNYGILGGDGTLGSDGLSNVMIESNTIINTGDDAIRFNNSNTDITISGNTLGNINDYGIYFEDNNSNLLISNNSIQMSLTLGEDSIVLEDNNTATITGNTFIGSRREAIDIGSGNTLRLTNNFFKGSFTRELFEFEGPTTNIIVDGSGNRAELGITNFCDFALNDASDPGTEGSFTGTLEVGTSQFVNGNGC